MSEIGTEAAAPAAEGTAAEAAPVDEFAALAARAVAATGGEEGDSEGAPADEPSDLPPPRKAKITSARDRILAKQAREAERQKVAPIEQQHQHTVAELNAIKARQAEVAERRQELYQKGDINGALKLAGLDDFQTLSRKMLEAKGAIPPSNPEVEAKLSRLEKLEAEREQERQRAAQEREQQEAEREFYEFRDEVVTELSEHKSPILQSVAKLPSFADRVAQMLASDDQLTTEQAAADLLPEYQALFEALAPVFGGGQKAPNAKKPGRAPAALRQTEAAEASGTPEEITDPDQEIDAWAKKFARMART